MMYWYLQVLKKFADFEGRARRTEYWMFVLFNLVFTLVAILLDNLAGTTIERLPYGLFYFLYVLAVLLPGLAVSVRRLHDIGKSGWMMLVSMIPLAGTIWLLVLLVTEGDSGENAYGPDPKATDNGQEQPEEAFRQTVGSDISRDLLILIPVCWLFLSQLIWFVINNWFNDVYGTDGFRVFSTLNSLIWGFVPLTLAFAARNKSMRTVLIVIGVFYFLIDVGQIIYSFIEKRQGL